MLNLIHALDTTQYEPVVILCADGPLADRLRSDSIETHILNLSTDVLKTRKDTLGLSTLGQFSKVVSVARYTLQLAALFKKLGADVVHTNSLKADIIGALAGRISKIPVIWHVRDRIDVDYLPKKVVKLFRWLSAFLPDHVITISQATRITLPQTTDADRFSVVHDGVSPIAFTNIQRNWFSQDSVHIGIIGRISPWKGQHVFIEAASQLRSRFPNASFEIIGSSMFEEHSYEQELRDLVTKNNLVDTVKFLGYRSDIFDVLQDLDVVVHASTIGEPFGQVIIEGMAAGKPVVATDGGAAPEIIENGVDGLIVPPKDATRLAQAIESLLIAPNDARNIGARGQQKVRNCFSIGNTARNVESVYERVLSAKK